MTISAHSPALLQSPYGQAGFYGQQGIAGFDTTAGYQQQFSPWGPYGQQGIEQLMPMVQLITQQLITAQQCVWNVQHLLAQAVPQVGQYSQQFSPFTPFSQFGQRQLPRQYPMAW